MSMRLLQKSEVNKAKALERDREVAEGLKLAKKVDALRELSAEEERSLMLFRAKTIEEIYRQTAAEQTKLEALKREVRVLEEKRYEALKPLTAELERIEKEQEQLSEMKLTRDKHERLLAESDEEIDARENTLALLEGMVSQQNAVAASALSEAEKLRDEATRKERLADGILKRAQNEASVLVANAEQREGWVLQREKAVLEKEESLRGQEIELAKEWSRLKDREQTLERNIKRLNK